MKRMAGYLLFLLVAVTLFTGCIATKVTSVWKDPAYQGSPKKVLVYAVLKTQMQRRVFEDEFVAHFKSRGVDAVPGYEVFSGEELVTKEVLTEKLTSLGFDSLLLTRVTGTRKELTQVPARTTYPSGGYGGGYRGYYSAGYTATYTSSYTVEDYYAMTETSLFDVATEKMFWSGAGDTWMRDSDQKMIKDYVAMMMEAIRKDKVIP